MPKQQLTHLEFARLFNTLKEQATKIQERLNKGATITELCAEYKTSPYSLKQAFEEIGIKSGRNLRGYSEQERVVALIAVVKRLCQELRVPCDELNDF